MAMFSCASRKSVRNRSRAHRPRSAGIRRAVMRVSFALPGGRLGAKRCGSSRQSARDLAAIAQRLGPAHAAAVQNQRVGRPRPSRGRQQPASSCFSDLDGIVGGGHEPDPVRDAQHMAVDRQVRECRTRGRARHWPSCGRRPAVSPALPSWWELRRRASATTASAIATQALRLHAKEARRLDLRLELFGRGFGQRCGDWGSARTGQASPDSHARRCTAPTESSPQAVRRRL